MGIFTASQAKPYHAGVGPLLASLAVLALMLVRSTNLVLVLIPKLVLMLLQRESWLPGDGPWQPGP